MGPSIAISQGTLHSLTTRACSSWHGAKELSGAVSETAKRAVLAAELQPGRADLDTRGRLAHDPARR